MFWEEDEDKTLPYQVPDDVIDMVFAIQSKTLPLNHAWPLSREIIKHLPWLTDYDFAGIHQIHVAESNNGWMRPEDDEEGAVLYPSKRTKLTIRIPLEKYDEASKMVGQTLNINGHDLLVGKAKKKVFTNAGVLFARYVLCEPNEDENTFLSKMAKEIKTKTGFKVKKMLCGKSHNITIPDADLYTKHLMIADLDSDTSIKIQQLGLGGSRELGCGIFLPHKSIKTLKPTE
ncbi:type I-MYXAN CRISPR-associated protein Cas6/Cmx6 [uncultured Cocleimonas sp.]|uniref:type I-MYXAN CRISPR-associated protein Cas6/Cmx6 n=1 Tax=uncultured Cocleimonas sp. TaxID=1051587 RepID=UPI00261C7F23|nr:type I-MYXAN CRISPR-associated protein Cas6/Cmx6 [uncultured Cocleimonas sp.]